MVAECSVSYSGRASSTARESVRLIILKQDGTVLVHEASGREPLNWQSKSDIVARLDSDQVVELRTSRWSPREELIIKITGNVWMAVTVLGNVGLTLFGKEEDLIEELSNNPSLIMKGATLIAKEVSTPYGRIDILLRDNSGRLIIVEVKRSRADIEAAQQLHRYVEYYSRLGLEVTGILVAPDISNQALKYLGDHGLRYFRYTHHGKPRQPT